MLLCDGSNFAKVDYPELYDVLPAILIVDANNGSVPDLRETFVIGAGAAIDEHDTGGADTHTLIEAEMPAHSHLYDKPTLDIDFFTVGPPTPTGIGQPMLPTQTSSAGSDGAHNNMPPYYALKYAVIAK
jgi:microcystin-dependent protein